MSLRDLIKRKMPATFNAAEYEAGRVLDRFDELMKTLLSVDAEQARRLEKLMQMLDEQAQRQRQLEEVISAQTRKLNERMFEEDTRKILYYCPHEVLSIQNGGFYEFREREDYPQRYLSLIRGLDDESLHTIERLLCRHLLVRGKENEKIDLFTIEEKNEISRIYTEFYTQILPLREGLYTWGGVLFPYPKAGMGWTETTVFIDRCGFEKVRYPERIRNQCILDVGAFAGDSALVFSPLTDEQVYAFEASPENFELLCETIKINGLENVIPILSAVGAQTGTATIQTGISQGAHVISEEAEEDKVEVEMISIDAFVRERGLKVGMIKVDIEGMEMQFLKGAEQTIRDQRPVLLLSIYHTAEDFFGIKPLLESWGLGYHFFIHKETNEHIHYDTMLIAEVFDTIPEYAIQENMR